MKLYEALVLPVLDFGATVITSSLTECSNEFGKVQRCAMLKSSGCRNSTSIDAFEILTNTLLVDLHLKLRQAQEMVRICAKHDEDPLEPTSILGYEIHINQEENQLFQLLMYPFIEVSGKLEVDQLKKNSSTQKS